VTFSAASSTLPALNSAALKKSANELRSYAAGIIAHIAIQTMYRIEHPGNFIITERSIWVGDSRASTISTILDNVDRVVDLAKAAAKATKGLRPSRVATPPENLWVGLTYLIDLSTNEGAAGRVVRKRYDIVDFGPMVLNPVSQVHFGEAYEIKSRAGAKAGKDYITKQTDLYNKTLEKLKTMLEEALNISGLGGYRLRLGRLWPTTPKVLCIGPNVLIFWREEPGLIVYQWLSYKRLSWKRLWEFVKRVQEDIRRAFETRSSLKPEVVMGLILMGVSAAFMLAMIGMALIEVAAGATPVLAPLLARLAQVGALTAGASAAASPQPGSVPGVSGSQLERLKEVLAAFDRMDDLHLLFDPSAYRRPISGEGLSGGMPQTDYEKSLYKMVDTLISETVFLYSIQVGQGNEFLSEYNLGILKENLYIFIAGFIKIYGLDNLLMLTGQTRSADLDETTALKIAEMIVALIGGNIESTRYGRFITNFFALSADDVDESLPRGYGEDGEIY
jgi:hypothetical protein